jgi:hypothetical protein
MLIAEISHPPVMKIPPAPLFQRGVLKSLLEKGDLGGFALFTVKSTYDSAISGNWGDGYFTVSIPIRPKKLSGSGLGGEKGNPKYYLGQEKLCIIQVSHIPKFYGEPPRFAGTSGRKKRPFGAILCRHLKKFRNWVRISSLFCWL